MSELLSSFWQISQITKSHGPHEWPMPGTLMGHTWAVTAGTHGDLQSIVVGPTFCPLLMSMLVPHGAPDSKIIWAPWMANEGHAHGPHMGCQWWGPWGLKTSCHAAPRYLPLLTPIWSSMGSMYVCNHPVDKIPWAPWGVNVCAYRNTLITGDRKDHPKRCAVARPGYPANKCIYGTQKSHETSQLWDHDMSRKQGYVFVIKLSPHIYAYIVICAENGIRITCGSQFLIHETAHVKPLS